MDEKRSSWFSFPMNVSAHMQCPSCHGSRMVLGQPELDRQFRPMGKSAFVGFLTYPVACLDCGFIGTCLSEDERAGLEKKLRES
ncbi:MAG TPA: hypothetical protein VHI52_08715 [Verrucomicrobiae bacterium]|nr:hypothetical protein [Verrucomicrobiae bacterium]